MPTGCGSWRERLTRVHNLALHLRLRLLAYSAGLTGIVDWKDESAGCVQARMQVIDEPPRSQVDTDRWKHYPEC